MSHEILLEVEAINKSFGEQVVSKDVSFSLKKGEIGCLLGPSGCGKTTLLRIIAGFEDIENGQVLIHGNVVSQPGLHVPPEKRSIGMVFQDYALFPHLTVVENISFGLGNINSRERNNRATEMLSLVGLEEAGKKYPHEISGGQQQRVALARALAPKPDLLLLDEPFSNLDAVLRDRLTVEVRDILKTLGTTALLVTHNQHEAFSVADKIGVVFEGQLQQWDDAYNIYHHPASLSVATFVGDGSLISGRVEHEGKISCALGLLEGEIPQPCGVGSEVELLIRPEDVLHVDDTTISAEIIHKSFRGATILYQLKLSSGENCQALVSSHHNHKIGEFIGITQEVDNLVTFPK